MTDWGVNPQGYIVKPLAQILRDIETKNIEQFGPGVIQTPQSPLGQINGVMASITNEVWQETLAAYNAYDIDVAEGRKLDIIGKLRIVSREVDETDVVLRKVIGNSQQGRFDLLDIQRSVQTATDVSWAKIWVNEGVEADENGMPPGSIAVAALGGTDTDVAVAARGYLMPGVIQFGNTRVDVVYDGYCRTMWIFRPTPVEFDLEMTVRTSYGRDNCPPPNASSISAGVLESLTTPRLDNGRDLTHHDVVTAVAELYGRSVEVVTTNSLPFSIDFDEIIDIQSVDVTIVE